MFGDRCNSQVRATRHRRRFQPGGPGRERGGLQRAEAAEGEEGHIGDALFGEFFDQPVVLAVSEVVHVLDAHDRRDRACLCDLCRRRVAHAEVPDQPLLLEFDECFEGLGERTGHGALGVAEPETDRIQRVETEVLQVLGDRPAQLFGLARRGPAALLVPGRADPGHDVQRVGVRCRASRINWLVMRGTGLLTSGNSLRVRGWADGRSSRTSLRAVVPAVGGALEACGTWMARTAGLSRGYLLGHGSSGRVSAGSA